MRLRLASAALVLAAAPALVPVGLAQSARVSGTVVDAETGAPLPGAHVFASGTSAGAAADRAGRFAFSVRPGPARLTATMLGYGTSQEDRLVRDGDSLSVAFRLAPDAVTLGEVEVVQTRDAAWARALSVFRPTFLGATPNAERTALVNPEVLDLSYERRRGLEAAARVPLVVRNEALGYELTFYDLELETRDADRAWRATLAYRDLCDGRACGAAVAVARDRAYAGSVDHFLVSLVRGRLAEEGFEVRRVSGPGRHGGSLFSAIGELLGLGDDDDDGAVEVRPAPHGWNVEADGALRVAFDGEPDADGGPQVSWLTAEGGVLRLSPDGFPLDLDDVVRYGHWDSERVADAVPRDYRSPAAAD